MARGFWRRAVGLLGRRGLEPDGGLVLPRCRSVHTFGMRFAIDVVFIDGRGRVARTCEAVKPWRCVFCRDAAGVLELSRGRVADVGVVEGDELNMVEAG